MPREPLTAIVTSYNEIEFIEDCIRSTLWADEVLLIDSYSDDGTVELVREKFPNVRIVQRPYYGAASQKNFGIDCATSKWILYVDADELVPDELRDEILKMMNGPLEFWAYSIGRRNFMMGKEVKYSGLQRDRVTRLFHREHARYPKRRVHTDLRVDGPTGALRHKMLHFYIRSFDHMIEKMTRYAIWGSAQLYLEKRKVGAWGIFSHAAAKFVRDYFVNLGFLDGTRGLIVVGMHVYYTFWKYAKLWELNQLKRAGKPVPLPALDESEGNWELPWLKKDAGTPPSA
jgi:glycosyltransferase involved in cell wall biosynthesis